MIQTLLFFIAFIVLLAAILKKHEDRKLKRKSK
jgi:hypothetical protein